MTLPDRSAEHALVEDFGLRIGRAMGWPPMAGRTSGVLLLSEKPLTLGELQDALDASKGSVSEMTRLLMVNGVVERTKNPGSRQFVYRWRDDAWLGCLQHQVNATRELLELAESAQEHGKHLAAEQRARLRRMRDYYVFMTEQLEALLAEYSSRTESDA
ncbi:MULTISPECIES: GbsR/MarR family transcriptional regulator [Amycolatopsis]|uniref:GbsR/MarR family transcriptional regulator n=1 Tax=Amycolatopsis TaxID=1813 RepID=UPI00106FE9FC|nr:MULTISPECIES: MarR family transcriptional regulator [Amycolatopsis]MCG3754833.1 MarR family transcriptional regulator [Amycolatopsis sp. Poz14]